MQVSQLFIYRYGLPQHTVVVAKNNTRELYCVDVVVVVEIHFFHWHTIFNIEDAVATYSPNQILHSAIPAFYKGPYEEAVRTAWWPSADITFFSFIQNSNDRQRYTRDAWNFAAYSFFVFRRERDGDVPDPQQKEGTFYDKIHFFPNSVAHEYSSSAYTYDSMTTDTTGRIWTMLLLPGWKLQIFFIFPPVDIRLP